MSRAGLRCIPLADVISHQAEVPPKLRCKFRSYTDAKVAATSNKSKLERSKSNSDIRTVKTWRKRSALVGDDLCAWAVNCKSEDCDADILLSTGAFTMSAVSQ